MVHNKITIELFTFNKTYFPSCIEHKSFDYGRIRNHETPRNRRLLPCVAERASPEQDPLQSLTDSSTQQRRNCLIPGLKRDHNGQVFLLDAISTSLNNLADVSDSRCQQMITNYWSRLTIRLVLNATFNDVAEQSGRGVKTIVSTLTIGSNNEVCSQWASLI
jgi:hypothetical protein